jgi:undecaprenyl-diphosphatase
MDLMHLAKAAFLGLVEGGTEFIPVSSTGHLILIGSLLGFENEGKTFEVLVQLGAILAIMLVYFKRLFGVVLCLHTDKWARQFATSIILAFLPAAFMGVLLHKYIKALFDKPHYVCVALILGGIILLWVDKQKWEIKEDNAFHITPITALKIGCFQCLAMFPGVSRSGSSIVGAMWMGVSKRAAAEFSFFLAMPTMFGAFVYDLGKNYKNLKMDDSLAIIIGFCCAFIAGYAVVRFLLDYISKNGFALFGWWRIIVGSLGLVGLFVLK